MTTSGMILLAFAGLLISLKVTLLSVAIVWSVKSAFEQMGLLSLGRLPSPPPKVRTRAARV